jgi:hypothetical protein
MKVVGHETKAVNLPGGFVAGLIQSAQQQPAIIVVAENGFSVIATIHDVVNGARILKAYLSSHSRRQISENEYIGQLEKMALSLTDPFLFDPFLFGKGVAEVSYPSTWARPQLRLPESCLSMWSLSPTEILPSEETGQQ